MNNELQSGSKLHLVYIDKVLIHQISHVVQTNVVLHRNRTGSNVFFELDCLAFFKRRLAHHRLVGFLTRLARRNTLLLMLFIQVGQIKWNKT
jgi:hypothetical protein